MLRRLFTDGVLVVLFCCTPGGTPYEMLMHEHWQKRLSALGVSFKWSG
ncbi:unnamed protein product [Ascophyllum nodosum]